MKQAVVLIHGIGEQKPMDTLRRFVGAVLPAAQPGREQYWSRPDPMAELFELRLLEQVGRPGTHFSEYYGAYHVEGTHFIHLAEWTLDLIRRKRHDVPEALRNVWRISRVVVTLLTISMLLGSVAFLLDWSENLPGSGLLWLVVNASLAALLYFLLYYLGDAARYLSPRPGNIELRQRIRAEGIQLLRKLHESGRYDRILVVGHSLGSVIGYDLITHLWQRYDPPPLGRLLAHGMPPRPVVGHALPTAGQGLTAEDPGALATWRFWQHQAWREQRRWGNPWRITDFITLGSPLAHAMLLLANSTDDFATRKRQRELPTCPPQRDEQGYAYASRRVRDSDGDGEASTPWVLHHAAPFAVTRWTNLYIPAKWGLLGDFVGGPLRTVLGLGIEDVAVQSPALGRLARHSPLAHTAYWREPMPGRERAQGEPAALPTSLDALRAALGLSRLRPSIDR